MSTSQIAAALPAGSTALADSRSAYLPPEWLALDAAPTGQLLTLRRAEGSPEFCGRLAALGLRRGARITVLQRTAGGGRIVAVAGGRIALDTSVLQRLFAEVVA